MAKNPNLIQFTMTADHREKLANLQDEESSIDLVAKRLLIKLLDQQYADCPSLSDRDTQQIKAKLADHEARLQALESPDHPIGRFLNKALKED